MFRVTEFRRLLATARRARTANAKGRTYEAVCRYLFNSLDGVKVHASNISLASEELDLALYNARIDQPFSDWEGIILVECKNWSSAVGAPAMDSFLSKLRRRGLQNGIFIAASGVTGTFYGPPGGSGAAGIITSALREKIRVIVLTNIDLDSITSVAGFRKLLIRKYCGIFLDSIV